MKYLLAFLFSVSAYAAGTFKLSGHVRSFSKTEIEIFDGEQIYSIKKDSLPISERKKIEHVKQGQKVELNINFRAVADVRDAKTHARF